MEICAQLLFYILIDKRTRYFAKKFTFQDGCQIKYGKRILINPSGTFSKTMETGAHLLLDVLINIRNWGIVGKNTFSKWPTKIVFIRKYIFFYKNILALHIINTHKIPLKMIKHYWHVIKWSDAYVMVLPKLCLPPPQ